MRSGIVILTTSDGRRIVFMAHAIESVVASTAIDPSCGRSVIQTVGGARWPIAETVEVVSERIQLALEA